MSPEESQDADLWRQTLVLRSDQLEQRMEAFEQQLHENTEATKRVDTSTRELVDILNSWKGAMKVMDFLAKFAKPLTVIASIGAAWATWRSQK
jgi:hypothetical protein